MPTRPPSPLSPRAYLAGPDVFRPDAAAVAARLKALCARHGLTGLFPLDGTLAAAPDEPPAALAARIRAANLALIRSADLVLANISPFRGPSADDGTAFEMGYALALELPVFAYSTATDTLLDRTARQFALTRQGQTQGQAQGQQVWRDPDGLEVEAFGLPANLMLVDPVRGGVHDGADAAIAAAARHFRLSPPPARGPSGKE